MAAVTLKPALKLLVCLIYGSFLEIFSRDLSSVFKKITLPKFETSLKPDWFEPDGMPATLSLNTPDFMSVYVTNNEDISLEELGQQTKLLLDSSLPESGGAVLIRGLTSIKNAADFATFWKACYAYGTKPWIPTIYDSFERPKDSGVDYVPNLYPDEKVLTCHNELVYFPKPMRKIMLFCLQDAMIGGESLLASNKKLKQLINPEIQDFTKKHGGIVITTQFQDGKIPVSERKSSSQTWHDRCKIDINDPLIDDIALAKKFFMERGYKEDMIHFDENRKCILTYHTSGYVKVDEDEEELWFNTLGNNIVKIKS